MILFFVIIYLCGFVTGGLVMQIISRSKGNMEVSDD